MPIVVVRIMGGLGNQMFQYSHGYALAKRLGGELQFDLSRLDNDTKRAESLSAFGIDLPIFLGTPKSDSVKWYNRVRKWLAVRGFRIVREKFYHYDRTVEDIRTNCILQGYWISERYFENCHKDIQNIFKLDKFRSGVTQEIYEEIKQCSSVSFHFRRGDFESDEKTKKIHGLLPMSYYEKARFLILSLVPDARFFIFSDDIASVRVQLEHWKNAVFVSSFSEHEDMMLMHQCTHNVIANSTFSWWGAYLNPDPRKIVIAPRVVFSLEGMRDRNICDHYPEDWILI